MMSLSKELMDLKIKVDHAREAAHVLFASTTRSDLLQTLSVFLRDVRAASRDLRWAQIVHPRGTDVIVPARADLWHRINEIDGLNTLLGRADFCRVAAALCACAAEPFRILPQPAPAAGAQNTHAAGAEGGSRVHRVLMLGERAVLPAPAVTLAEQMDGSFGGGHEEAVMWNEFDGIKKLADGKYHFVRQARVAAEGEQAARGGAGLWDFAMQGYGVHATAAMPAATAAMQAGTETAAPAGAGPASEE